MQVNSLGSVSNTNFGLRYGKKTTELLNRSREAVAKKGPKELAAWDEAKAKLDNCIVAQSGKEDYLLCHQLNEFSDRRKFCVVSPFKIDKHEYGVLSIFGSEPLNTKYIEKIIERLTKRDNPIAPDDWKYQWGFKNISKEYYEM